MSGGDFNGDGLTDAVVLYDWQGTPCPSSSSIYLGDQSGTNFTQSNYTASYAGPTYPAYDCNGPADFYAGGLTPGVTDANGDGFSDAFVRDRSTGSNLYYFLQNNRSGALPQVGSSLYALTLIGDFNGDGLTDWFQQNDGNSGTHSYFSNGDGTFSLGQSYSGIYSIGSVTLYAADFDGDGCTDVLAQHTVNEIVYSCNPAVSQITVPKYDAGSAKFVLADFNGDGKTDVLVAPTSGPAQLYLSTGTGFTAPYTINAINRGTLDSTWGTDYNLVVGDFNADGKTDVALIPVNDGNHYPPFYVLLSTGTDLVLSQTLSEPSGTNSTVAAVVADWNSDGAADFWIQQNGGDTEYLSSYVPELMTSVSNGIGATTTITYDRLNRNGSFYAKGTTAAYPTQDVDGPLYVVSRVDASNGLGACAPPGTTNCYSSTYSYAGAKSDLRGRGFLGFSTMTVTDAQTGIVQTTNYRTDFPFVGLIASQTKVSGSVTVNSTTNSYVSVSLGTDHYDVELQQTVAASTDLDGTAMPTTTTTYTYDCDSNPNPCYGNTTQISVAVSDGSSKTTTNTYTNDATNWFLGRLTQATVNSVVGSSNLTRTSSFQYDTGTGLLTQEVVEPNASWLRLETDYQYDAFGNKTRTTVSGGGIATRSNTATYNSAGEFMTQGCNALNQCESWAYDARFGLATSHTGPNNLTTAGLTTASAARRWNRGRTSPRRAGRTICATAVAGRTCSSM